MSQYIPGIGASIEEAPDGSGPYLHIRSATPLRTLNTSVWGGGFGSHRHLVNRQVAKSYASADPQAEMGRFLAACGIAPEESCGMLTAAYVRDGAYAAAEHAWDEPGGTVSLRVASWVTAGLGNACRAGAEQPLGRLYPGTINIIVVVSGMMSDAAMAGAVVTATEAKAAVLQELNVRAHGSDLTATGTTTDAVLIAAANTGGRELVYAGTATVLGYLIGRTVYTAASEACGKYLERQSVRQLLMDPGK